MLTVDWNDYFMGIAGAVSKKSKDPNTKVGAVVVDQERVIVSTGFNGPPIGVEDLPERFERPAKYAWIAHAEICAVTFAARRGVRTEGCAVYVTHHPCASCAKTLIQGGIMRVVIGDGQTSMPADEFRAAAIMFAEAGVKVERL